VSDYRLVIVSTENGEREHVVFLAFDNDESALDY